MPNHESADESCVSRDEFDELAARVRQLEQLVLGGLQVARARETRRKPDIARQRGKALEWLKNQWAIPRILANHNSEGYSVRGTQPESPMAVEGLIDENTYRRLEHDNFRSGCDAAVVTYEYGGRRFISLVRPGDAESSYISYSMFGQSRPMEGVLKCIIEDPSLMVDLLGHDFPDNGPAGDQVTVAPNVYGLDGYGNISIYQSPAPA